MRGKPDDVADQPARHVDHVRTEIAEDAGGTGAVVPPLVLADESPRADEGELAAQDAAEPAGVDEMLEILEMRLPAPGVEHHVLAAAGLGLPVHRFGVG